MKKNTKEITIKLSDFASIDVGYPLHRGVTLFEPYHTYKAYQSPSCSEEADTYCYSAPIPEQYITREGDIILNTAKLKDITLIEKEQEGLLVSDRYLIIRCNRSKALPGFIRNEMLSDTGCEKRRKLCRDAVLPHQKAMKYADLKFKLPDMEMQEMICEIQTKLEENIQKFADELAEKLRQEEEERRKQHKRYMQALYSCYGRIIQPADESTPDTDDSSD